MPGQPAPELIVVGDAWFAEYVALWFKQAGMENTVYWYAKAVIACTLLVCWFMRDTQATSKIDAEI